jgi:hypothetical protein
MAIKKLNKWESREWEKRVRTQAPLDLSHRDMYRWLPEETRAWIRKETKPGLRRKCVIEESFEYWSEELRMEQGVVAADLMRDLGEDR